MWFLSQKKKTPPKSEKEIHEMAAKWRKKLMEDEKKEKEKKAQKQ